MASAILAGANPVQGLYALMIGTPPGSLLGSSAFMNVSATNALAITAGMALTSYTGASHYTALATLAVLTGIVMLSNGNHERDPGRGKRVRLYDDPWRQHARCVCGRAALAP